MTRKRKFQIDQEAWWGDRPVVIIGWRVRRGTQSQYRVLRLTHPVTGQPYGAPIWVDAQHLRVTDDEDRRRRSVRRIVNANKRLGSSEERGCKCQCCVHTAVPRSALNNDGTFKWEEAYEET